MEATRRAGYTLLEVTLVLVLLTMFAGITVPRYANFLVKRRTESAVRRLSADLLLARRRAVLTSTAQTVTFDILAEAYTVGDMKDPDRPTLPYRVKLGDSPYRADIVSAVLGGDSSVIFDGYGAPDTGGTIVVRVGGFEKTITIGGTTAVIDVGGIKPSPLQDPMVVVK